MKIDALKVVMLFVIQRADCDAFAACHDLDPAYARGLTEAAAKGVEVLAYACDIAVDAVRVARRIPWQPQTQQPPPR